MEETSRYAVGDEDYSYYTRYADGGSDDPPPGPPDTSPAVDPAKSDPPKHEHEGEDEHDKKGHDQGEKGK